MDSRGFDLKTANAIMNRIAAVISDRRPMLAGSAIGRRKPSRARCLATRSARANTSVCSFSERSRWHSASNLSAEETSKACNSGSAVMPDSTLEEVLQLIQNYDDHKNIYKPDVIDSKLIRTGSHFQVYLRFLKKKIITVVLDTDHEVNYHPLDRTRWLCRSYTSRIAEVESAGRREERVLPPDTGHGFLWRLHSYWRFQQRDGGVIVECRAISLTRDVPFGLGWAIEPIIQKLPKESLINTLKATRLALQARTR